MPENGGSTDWKGKNGSIVLKNYAMSLKHLKLSDIFNDSVRESSILRVTFFGVKSIHDTEQQVFSAIKISQNAIDMIHRRQSLWKWINSGPSIARRRQSLRDKWARCFRVKFRQDVSRPTLKNLGSEKQVLNEMFYFTYSIH